MHCTIAFYRKSYSESKFHFKICTYYYPYNIIYVLYLYNVKVFIKKSCFYNSSFRSLSLKININLLYSHIQITFFNAYSSISLFSLICLFNFFLARASLDLTVPSGILSVLAISTVLIPSK